jgi:hypothetical protein
MNAAKVSDIVHVKLYVIDAPFEKPAAKIRSTSMQRFSTI